LQATIQEDGLGYIATGLVDDANIRQYLNPESNDFSSSAT
jgi:hypothetical protein